MQPVKAGSRHGPLPIARPNTYMTGKMRPARKASPTGTRSMTQPFVNIPADGIAIRARGIRKIYTGAGGKAPKQALDDIDLDIPVGAVFGLLGPNGAGKSTFINIMAGTVIKSAGSIGIWGTDIDDNPRQARANIGIVPQELNIDAYFTPRQQLEFQAGLFGVRPSERRSDEILEMVGLSDQAHTYARRLSGGMRRRLLVAKAMVHSPPILVLDEPTAGVDVALRQRLWDNIRALNEAGVTIVLTTHYLEEAEALCDRIAILNHGRLIANQPKDQLMAGARAKELRMTLTGGTPAQMPAALAALGAQPVEGGILVRYDPAVTGAAAIITAVAATGLEISDVTTVEPDLEDVFLEMTGGMA
jgi:ABC-2 type transport system ATP-binding protein